MGWDCDGRMLYRLDPAERTNIVIKHLVQTPAQLATWNQDYAHRRPSKGLPVGQSAFGPYVEPSVSELPGQCTYCGTPRLHQCAGSATALEWPLKFTSERWRGRRQGSRAVGLQASVRPPWVVRKCRGRLRRADKLCPWSATTRHSDLRSRWFLRAWGQPNRRFLLGNLS